MIHRAANLIRAKMSETFRLTVLAPTVRIRQRMNAVRTSSFNSSTVNLNFPHFSNAFTEYRNWSSDACFTLVFLSS